MPRFFRWVAAGAAAAAVMAAGLAGGERSGAAAATEKSQGVIASSKTEFNNAQVRREGSIISLEFVSGRCTFTETQYDESDPALLPVAYTRTITAALAYPEKPRSLLEIGVGGARTISYLNLHMPALAITGVEIDPGVIDLARKHFGLKEKRTLKIVIDDGRRFLMQPGPSYDVILVDAYRGTWVPETLTTVEFFELAKARLNPGGVIAQNVEPSTLFYDRMLATIATVFDQVEVIPSGSSNVVIVGYDGARLAEAELLARAERLQKAHALRHPLAPILKTRRTDVTPTIPPMRDGFPEANTALMIDKANSADTPRRRREMCE